MCLRRWEGIKAGMLEGQVQDGLLRAGLGREAVGTVEKQFEVDPWMALKSG